MQKLVYFESNLISIAFRLLSGETPMGTQKSAKNDWILYGFESQFDPSTVKIKHNESEFTLRDIIEKVRIVKKEMTRKDQK